MAAVCVVTHKGTGKKYSVYKIAEMPDWGNLERIPTIFLVYHEGEWAWVDADDYEPFIDDL